MANFNCKCGNQDLEYKSGVGKTGKPWQGWKCKPCNIMYGMDGRPWGDKGSKPNVPPTPLKTQINGIVAPDLNAKIDQILAILKENFPPLEKANQELQTEAEPF